MTIPYEEPVARIGISQILHKVTSMEQTLAVMACDLKALRATTGEEISDLESRVRIVESDRWPWAKIGGIVAVAALTVTIVFGLTSTDNRPPPPPPSNPTSGP